MWVNSEQPNLDMWRHLKFLSFEENCKRLLKGEIKSNRKIYKIDDIALEKKSKQIAMCIKQAGEYFYAAEQVSINTSPLLFYYGMLSLAKALIITNIEGLFLEQLAYHGLTTKANTGNHNKDSSLWKIEAEIAVVNDGVFKEFANIFNTVLENKMIFKFKDLLSVDCENYQIYERFYNESSRVLLIQNNNINQNSGKHIQLTIHANSKEEVYKHIPEMEKDFSHIIQSQPPQMQFSGFSLNELPEYIHIVRSNGFDYIIGSIDYELNGVIKKKCLNPIVTDYMIMYILSMCVRYKQDFWGDIIVGKQNGILGLLQLYIPVIKRNFPNKILNYLFNEQFTFSTPTLWM